MALFAGTLPTPRILPLPEGQWTDLHRELVKTYGRDGPVNNVTNVANFANVANDFRTFLNHPDLVKGVLPFANYISSESTLSPRHRELLILRTAWLCRSEYQWAHHAPTARKAGLAAGELRRIAAGPDAPGWDRFESVLLRAADELHVNAFVSDSTWNGLIARYDTHQMMDAVFTVAEFTMLSEVVNAVGVQVEIGLADRLPADVARRVAVVKSDERLIGKKARIDALDPAKWDADVRAMLDPSGSGRAVAAVYRTYAQHPKMYAPRQLLSEYIRLQATLDARARELLIMRIGWLCRSDYEWATHAPAGRRAGMTAADVDHIIAGPQAGADSLPDNLLRAVDELYADDTISDSTWQALAVQLNAKQLLDLLITTGGYRMVSMSLNTFGVQLEPGGERLPAPR
jgi:4-carboxymuconolactone decarboxylase